MSGKPDSLDSNDHRSIGRRLVACLYELYQGALPTWLATVQLLAIPVSQKFSAYGEQIVSRFRARMVRAEFVRSSETIARNVLDATPQRVPNVVVVGGREQAAQSVTLRRFGVEEQIVLGLDEFERSLVATIQSRSRQ